MTWKEFKDSVESQGVKDDDSISFIDCSGSLRPRVERTPKGYVQISEVLFPDEEDEGGDDETT
jgi:hypothetical protein